MAIENRASLCAQLFVFLFVARLACAQTPKPNWDPPAITASPRHDDVVRDMSMIDEFVETGRQLFKTRFNVIDGAGRPEATGDSKPTTRLRRDGSLFNRIAGPDANSCAGCHNQPIQGGSGDYAANVFVGAHFTDPPTISADPKVTNERNTTSIFGAGAVEMLAREITEELISLRDNSLRDARNENSAIKVRLLAKGIDFGQITARPDGTYDTSDIQGIDDDLIVKPFGWKGVAVSLREFTNFALNQHHGMQSEERFGWERTGRTDFDGDGVKNEITPGQLSALSVYQASLPPPIRITYKDSQKEQHSRAGEREFKAIGCARCHIDSLPLRSRYFSEPNPYNRPGTAIPNDFAGVITVPIRVSEGTGLYRGADGDTYVAAYTDFKRHRICDKDDPYFCNERRPQDFVPTDAFLTPKLWDVGTSAPYGHRGDLTTVSEAIIHHSGEAKNEKTKFLALSDQEKREVILFLLSLQVREDTQTTR